MSAYYFNEDHEMFRKGLQDFLNKEVKPYIDEWEEQRQIPKSLWKKFGEMGYFGLMYPEEYGGVNADFWYSVIFVEEISKCFSGGFGAAASVHAYMSTPYILKHGSEKLKQKYLPKAIAGEIVGAVAITEPGAGSDVQNIQTRAIKQGDYYIVNGAKTFITNAYFGDYMVAVVKTNPEAGAAGVSLLVIDRNADGVSARKLKKLGWHASDTAELNFDDVKVPAENLIGEEGQGFYYLMGGLQLERLVGAVGAIAGSSHSIEYALQYMSERQAFGRPINRFQVLRHRIAQMSSEVEAIRYFVYHCCRLHNDDQYAVKECSMAKLLATELSDKVAYQCLQFFGGYGYMEEYKAARFFRDSRILTIGGGSSEIMREIIAKMVIDDTNYKRAGKNGEATNHQPKPQKVVATVANGHSTEENETILSQKDIDINIMSLENLTNGMKERAANAPTLGATLKFDFGDDGCIYLDGTGEANQITNDDNDADCIVTVSKSNFEKLATGDMNPMSAFMTGKIKVSGNMGLAMKLQQFLG